MGSALHDEAGGTFGARHRGQSRPRARFGCWVLSWQSSWSKKGLTHAKACGQAWG